MEISGIPLRLVNNSMRCSQILSYWEFIYMFGGSHESDFHNLTRYGSKMCHGSVTCVTCDTTWHGVDGVVSPPILLVLNLTQLKSRGIRLWKRLSHMKPVLSMTRQEQ